MIESADLMLLRVLPMGIFFLVIFEIFVLVALLLGGLPDGASVIAYACLAFLTAPVWGGILFLGMAWIADWAERKSRARRIARCKAAKLAAVN